MNYYERHIGDYLKDTAHLSLLEHGVYGRLLDVYYTRECGIEEADAARLIGARAKDEKAALQTVLIEFFELASGVWTHKRCDAEIKRYMEKQRKASASANARWKKDKPHSEGNANAMRTHSEGNAPNHQTPDTRHQTTTLSSKEIVVGGDEVPKSPAEWLEWFGEWHGVDIDHRSIHDRKKFWPLATAWASAGVTKAQMQAAIEHAQSTAKEPIAWLPAYADRVLAGMARPNAQQSLEERNAAAVRQALEDGHATA